jgi:hypothetical protein
MLKRTYFLAILIIVSVYSSKAQSSVLDVGLRLQKDVGLYHENGISVSYSDKNLKPDRLYFGFTYVTSRLGSAFNSNAIKQDNFLVSAGWYFKRDHTIRPFVRANVGYFASDYPELFSVLPHTSLLFSTDAGLSVQTHLPLKLSASLGYNLISGKGNNNTPGTIYPIYYQFTFSWNILKHKK